MILSVSKRLQPPFYRSTFRSLRWQVWCLWSTAFKSSHFNMGNKYGYEYIWICIRKKNPTFPEQTYASWFPPRPLPLWRFCDKFVVELWSSQLHKEQQGKMIAHHILPWCSCVIQGDYTDSGGISYWLPALSLTHCCAPSVTSAATSPACWLLGDLVCAEKRMMGR